MQTRRWTNQGLPQTLQVAVFLLYARAVFTAFLGTGTGLGVALATDFQDVNRIENLARLVVVVGGALGGYLIANERKQGYALGIAVAALPLVAIVIAMVRFQYNPLNGDLVGLLFDIALFALLLHPQSRSYVRLWFK